MGASSLKEKRGFSCKQRRKKKYMNKLDCVLGSHFFMKATCQSDIIVVLLVGFIVNYLPKCHAFFVANGS